MDQLIEVNRLVGDELAPQVRRIDAEGEKVSRGVLVVDAEGVVHYQADESTEAIEALAAE